MSIDNREVFEMVIHDAVTGPAGPEGYQHVAIATSRGTVECRYYPVAAAQRAALWAGGIGGGWDSPAHGLYPRLCNDLVNEGMPSLRVRYRHPTDLEESVLDVLAGVDYLEDQGVERVALAGHSFGGAVVLQAGALSHAVLSVITLSTQSYGADAAAELAPACSLLAVHGAADEVLPPSCSRYVYRVAHEPKRLVVLEGAHHGLDEVPDEVYRVVRDWILEALPAQV